MVVRAEQPGDAASVRAIHAASFPTPAEARLVDMLRESGRLRVSLVAEAGDGRIVGHVAFSPVTTTFDATGAGLGPIAVAGPHRRQSVAAELVRAGLAACREAGFDWVVVLGDPRYYARFGFRPAAEFGLYDEFRGGLAFQALQLVDGALPINAGLVRYAPEFASLPDSDA